MFQRRLAMRLKQLFSRSLRWSRVHLFSLIFVEGSRNQQQMSSHTLVSCFRATYIASAIVCFLSAQFVY